MLMHVNISDGKRHDPSYKLTDNSGMGLFEFCMHVFLLGLAFAFGYFFGRQQHTLQVEPRGQRTEFHADASTNMYLTEIEVQIEDLTIDAIRERLRGLQCAVSGAKPELVLRLQAALHNVRARVVVAR